MGDNLAVLVAQAAAQGAQAHAELLAALEAAPLDLSAVVAALERDTAALLEELGKH